ncbi:MAG: hypothetical protein WCR53_00600 [Bacteroidaceae bacterium]|jgi:hypothetical protein|nr:hypothetical protein [Bacteroidaceae bacterium]
MNIFSVPFVWLSRFRYRKGFGVQSPFAYHFICDIINGDGEYYAFRELRAERHGLFHRASGNSLKMDKLLFRLANFAHPDTIFAPERGMDLGRRYLSEGCTSAALYVFRDTYDLRNTLSLVKNVGLLYLDASSDCDTVFKMAFPFLSPKSLVIIKDIHRNDHMRNFWNSLKEDPRIILSFDIFYAGILLFDHKYVKQHYIVNF